MAKFIVLLNFTEQGIKNVSETLKRSERALTVHLKAPLQEEAQLRTLSFAVFLMVFGEEAADGLDPLVDMAKGAAVVVLA